MIALPSGPLEPVSAAPPTPSLRRRAARLRPWAIALLLFAVALAVRWLLIDDVRFLGDEAAHYSTARRIASFEQFPLLGTPNSSGGRGPSPLFYWFMALPQFVSRAPEASMGFVALLGALCPVMLYDMLRHRFGELGAFLAGATFAVAPWPVLSTLRIWDPHIGLFLATLALWSAARVRERPRSAAIFTLVVSAASLPGIHLGSVILYPGLLVIVWPVLRELRWGLFTVGVFVGAATYIPGLISELDTDFANIEEILAMRGSAGVVVRAGWGWVPVYVLRFLTTDVSYFLLTGYFGGLDETAAVGAVARGIPAWPAHPLRLLAFLASALLATVATFVAAYRALRQPKYARHALSPRALVLSTLVILVTAMYLLGSRGRQIYPHYVIYSIPWMLTFYAVLCREVRGSKLGTGLVVAACVIFWAGSFDATDAVVQAIDGRCSIGVQRRVLERLYQDAAADGLEPGDPVRLDMSFRCGHPPYNALAEHAYGESIPFTGVARRRYRLQLPDQPPPAIGRDRLDLGTAVLFRVDPPPRPETTLPETTRPTLAPPTPPSAAPTEPEADEPEEEDGDEPSVGVPATDD